MQIDWRELRKPHNLLLIAVAVAYAILLTLNYNIHARQVHAAGSTMELRTLHFYSTTVAQILSEMWLLQLCAAQYADFARKSVLLPSPRGIRVVGRIGYRACTAILATGLVAGLISTIFERTTGFGCAQWIVQGEVVLVFGASALMLLFRLAALADWHGPH